MIANWLNVKKNTHICKKTNKNMKKILLALLLFTSVLTSCTKKQKAEKMIKDYLFETLHDFDSYKPVSFSSLKEVRNSDFTFQMYTDYLKEGKTELADVFKEKWVEEKKEKNDLVGYKIEHSYRARTLGGSYKLASQTFVFDSEMKFCSPIETEEGK